jgi:crotonobetainyl-CoA:carnitine CoA-transferase CaiB-like acyl-CoA transferase
MLDRAIIGLILVASLTGGAVWGYKHVKKTGRQEVRAELKKATDEAIEKRNHEIAAEKLKQNEITQKVVNDYEAKLKDQSASYDKRIAAINAAGGLRITANRGKGLATTTQAASAGPDNEANTIRLPQSVESDLYAFARRADEVIIQLGACQNWIRDNGFYK